MLKMTMPTAFTTALLAWGLLTFPRGYSEAGMTATAQSELQWGANYLLKAVGGTNASYLISQVSLSCGLSSGAQAMQRLQGALPRQSNAHSGSDVAQFPSGALESHHA